LTRFTSPETGRVSVTGRHGFSADEPEVGWWHALGLRFGHLGKLRMEGVVEGRVSKGITECPRQRARESSGPASSVRTLVSTRESCRLRIEAVVSVQQGGRCSGGSGVGRATYEASPRWWRLGGSGLWGQGAVVGGLLGVPEERATRGRVTGEMADRGEIAGRKVVAGGGECPPCSAINQRAVQ